MPDIRLVDTHCHVDFSHFDEDRDEALARFRQVGGQWLVAVAVDLDNIPRLFALAEAHDDVYCSIGIHPNHEVDVESTVEQLCDLAAHPKCVAIGETGMDFFRHRVTPEVQEARFRTHIRAAKQLNKPVIVHMREADTDTLRVLKEEGVTGGIMHCFSSCWETARQALDLGMSVSFSGNVTFRQNDELREVARRVPEDRILIETDAPYLSPMPYRGKRNEPAYVHHVAECIAEVRGVSVKVLAETTTENACQVFHI